MKLHTLDKAYKSLVHLPAWQQQLLDNGSDFQDHIGDVQDAYSKVPLVYRAVKMRCDALASVPILITKLKGDAEAEWPFEAELPDLIWKTEAALLGAGISVIIKLKNRVRTLDLQWLNPFTVTVNYIDNKMVFHQGELGIWQAEDVIYIKEFSYSDDVTSGASTVQACLNDAALMNYQTRFASRFFEAGAMPIVLLSAENIVDDEKARIQNFFTKLASGVGNAWRVLATRTKLTPEVVSQDLDKMTMPELYSQASKNISAAFGIPVTLFQGDDNYASADSHRMQFWQDVVRPRGRMIEAAFNKQLLKQMGLKMTFNFDEMDIFQADENDRATSWATYVREGADPDTVAEMLGIEVPDGKSLMAPKPEPVAPVIVTPPVENTDYEDELAKWERKAVKRLEKGKNADCEFESEVIPAGMQSEIHTALNLCVTAEEVKRVFGGGYDKPSDYGLYAELKRANDLLERQQSQQPINVTVNTPDVVVNTPEVKTDIHMPEQGAPTVNVTNEVNPTPIEVKAEAPVVNITNEVNPTPVTIENNVTVQKPEKLTVIRNRQDKITGMEAE